MKKVVYKIFMYTCMSSVVSCAQYTAVLSILVVAEIAVVVYVYLRQGSVCYMRTIGTSLFVAHLYACRYTMFSSRLYKKP